MADAVACACSSCPNRGGKAPKLQVCSICREPAYCGKDCQKKAWSVDGHKYRCAKEDVPRHAVDRCTIEDLQAVVDKAEAGDIILLKPGEYHSTNNKSRATLQISQPVKLWGPATGGMDSGVTLHCKLEVNEEMTSDGVVSICNLSIVGTVKVQTNHYESITFSCVRVHQPDPKEDGVMVHIFKRGKCLFFGCELIGGDEALYIDGIDDLSHSNEDNEDKVHIKRTTIRNGGKRGICADDKFILERSIIKDNGWYGIRSNRGWTDKGGNQWQRNPTKPNQSPTGGGGMFDGMRIPMGGSGGLSFGRTGDTMFPGFGQM